MSNDHIALPESTLKRFGVSGFIYYLDLADNKIKDDKAKNYNSNINYYPKITEDFLNKKVETDMGRLVRQFDKLVNGDINSLPKNSDQLKEWACQCFAIQWLRTDKSKNIVHSKSKLAEVFNLDANYFDILRRGHIQDTKKGFIQNIFENNVENNLDDKVESLKQVLLSNNQDKICIPAIIDKRICSSSFLLPTTHFMAAGDMFFLIISPYYALTFIPKVKCNQTVISYQTNQAVDDLIPYSILVERSYGNGHIVGLKDQLEKAKPYALYFSKKSI